MKMTELAHGHVYAMKFPRGLRKSVGNSRRDLVKSAVVVIGALGEDGAPDVAWKRYCTSAV